jgi:hypothetical protein
MFLKVVVSLFLLTAGAYAQNTCTYQISTKPVDFCLTTSGTLATLNGMPMDEGWSWAASDAEGGRSSVRAFPGHGISFPATVTQPNGAGTLPVNFDWGNGFTQTVTVKNGSIVLTMKVRSCKGCTWFDGTSYRAANFTGFLGIAGTSGIAYNNAQGFLLSSGCGVASDVLTVDVSAGCQTSGATVSETGAVYVNFTPWESTNGTPATWVTVYRPF